MQLARPKKSAKRRRTNRKRRKNKVPRLIPARTAAPAKQTTKKTTKIDEISTVGSGDVRGDVPQERRNEELQSTVESARDVAQNSTNDPSMTMSMSTTMSTVIVPTTEMRRPSTTVSASVDKVVPSGKDKTIPRGISIIDLVRTNKGKKLTKAAKEKRKNGRMWKRLGNSEDGAEESSPGSVSAAPPIESAQTMQTQQEQNESHQVQGDQGKSTEMLPASMRPTIKIVDGEVVVDSQTVIVNTANASDQAINVVFQNEGSLEGAADYRVRVTSSSFRKSCEKKVSKWTAAETRRFYKSLRECGMDFGMIARLFPNRSRRSIKHKFKREDKNHPKLIASALNKSLPLDLDMYLSPADSQAIESTPSPSK